MPVGPHAVAQHLGKGLLAQHILGFPKMEVPKNGWLFREIPIKIWMIFGVSPISGNPPFGYPIESPCYPHRLKSQNNMGATATCFKQ